MYIAFVPACTSNYLRPLLYRHKISQDHKKHLIENKQ